MQNIHIFLHLLVSVQSSYCTERSLSYAVHKDSEKVREMGQGENENSKEGPMTGTKNICYLTCLSSTPWFLQVIELGHALSPYAHLYFEIKRKHCIVLQDVAGVLAFLSNCKEIFMKYKIFKSSLKNPGRLWDGSEEEVCIKTAKPGHFQVSSIYCLLGLAFSFLLQWIQLHIS